MPRQEKVVLITPSLSSNDAIGYDLLKQREY